MADTGTYLSTLDAEFDRLARAALLAILGMALAYSGIAIANTHLMATAGRTRELTALRLAGATPGQVLRLVGIEALLATGAGILLATVVTAATLGTLAAALGTRTGTVPIVVPWPAVAAVAGISLLIATLASLVPVAAQLRRT